MAGWSGDFGDSLSPEEILRELDPFIGMVEAERHSREVPRDDVMQEARIAAWKAIKTKAPDNLKAYLIATVKTRTVGVMARQDWTGRPSRQGRHDPDALTASGPLEDSFMLEAADLLDGIDLSYHYGEVMDALGRLTLPQREYVYMRFWLGMTEAEIAAVKGTTKARENALWNRTIRPALAAELAHLGA